MKKIIVAIFVLLTQLNYSQTTIKLDDFDEIKVFDQLNVTLVPSTENKVEITGKNESSFETVNKNGVLKLRMKLAKILSGDGTKVTLYFKNIKSIDANEGSIVSCAAVFKQTTIDLSSQEAAKIEVDLDVDNASIKISSGGIVSLTGKAVTQKAIINSGGLFYAKDLVTSQTSVSVSAGGSADVNATTLVNAKVNAGGSISIYGKPKEIKQETFAGGTIIEK
ncbi:head GIN domain-containing protein [Flavobacterium alvei]|uniref:head GIN domain-containing protein n=1 Tax=Flavobacterium alvei TaxID=2080416 RepID=UPI0026EB9F03|nr:head GIN domain-containing protein [Flavobacterium alvei]